jgi:hypothetical protein
VGTARSRSPTATMDVCGQDLVECWEGIRVGTRRIVAHRVVISTGDIPASVRVYLPGIGSSQKAKCGGEG